MLLKLRKVKAIQLKLKKTDTLYFVVDRSSGEVKECFKKLSDAISCRDDKFLDCFVYSGKLEPKSFVTKMFIKDFKNFCICN